MKNINDKAWITWERQPRNASMATLFEADFYEFNYAQTGLPRYTKCILNTCKVFSKNYPLVFVQNPSIVLAFVAVVLAKLYRVKVIIDAHNAGVKPKEGKSFWFQSFNNWILRRANLTIVTNSKLQQFLEERGVATTCIPDPLPAIQPIQVQEHNEYAFIICSWAVDEPIQLYLDAAKHNPHVEFRFTGNFKKYFTDGVPELPQNIKLLGFVSEEQYVKELTNCGVAIDLTTREDCLVCGAYESIALNVPVILTNTTVNRELFGDAAVYSDLSVEGLNSALTAALTAFDGNVIDNFKQHYADRMLKAKMQCLAALNV